MGTSGAAAAQDSKRQAGCVQAAWRPDQRSARRGATASSSQQYLAASGGRVWVGKGGRGRHIQLQDQQRDSDGHHAVGQSEQAVHARQIAARTSGDGIGRHRHLALHITARR